jgi:aspartate kinase
MRDQMVQNASPNGWVVQKFGGTSVGKFPDQIAEQVIRYERAYKKGPTLRRFILIIRVRPWLDSHKLVVVCSARSTGKKVTGTTSR